MLYDVLFRAYNKWKYVSVNDVVKKLFHLWIWSGQMIIVSERYGMFMKGVDVSRKYVGYCDRLREQCFVVLVVEFCV
jgi:hypothetical protein